MKIAIISQPEYFRAFYENDLDVLGDVREFQLKYTMTEADFVELEKFNADFNFFFRGEFVPDGVLKRLQGHKVSFSSEPFPNYVDGKLNYSPDSLHRFEKFKNITTKSYDYIFHYDKSSLQFLAENGLHLSGEFVFPIALNVYKKKNLDKKWDVFFIGRSTAYRERFLGLLKHYKNVLHIAHGVYGSELVDFINQSKLVLNLHAENEISWEPRVQMLLACGGMLLSHKITNNDYLIPGVDYIEIDNDDPSDLFSKVDYYLENSEKRSAIAANGLKKIQRYFDSVRRFRELIDGIDNGKYEKVHFDHEKISQDNNMFKTNKRMANKFFNKLLNLFRFRRICRRIYR
ncbi:MAG: glycosyltransferase [Desulfobulbaceae bacterium]|nr:glycosyltransferase [Desulfobulbaceae bacterium]